MTVVNRKNCCQHRINCFQLQMIDKNYVPVYAYNFDLFGAARTYYDLKPTEHCSLNAMAVPPPPAPPSPPLVPTCPGGAGRFARYVRLSYAGGCGDHGFLNFAELHFNYGYSNVAKDQVASAQDNAFALGPDNAVDGKPSTYYVSTSKGPTTWWQVDLGVSMQPVHMPVGTWQSSHAVARLHING